MKYKTIESLEVRAAQLSKHEEECPPETLAFIERWSLRLKFEYTSEIGGQLDIHKDGRTMTARPEEYLVIINDDLYVFSSKAFELIFEKSE